MEIYVAKKKTPYNNGLYFFGKKFTNKILNKGPNDVRVRKKTYHQNKTFSNEHIFDSYCSNLHNENNVYGIINVTH